jgi:hypothetical protein
VPAADGSLQGEITALLNFVYSTQGPGGTPPWTYNIATSSWVCPPGTYNQGQDPWQACLDMANSAGFELYFDINGNIQGQPAPGSPAGGTINSLPVVWNFAQNQVSAQGDFANPIGGSPYTTPVGIAVEMTREGIYNDFWVSATGPNNATGGNTPVQAEAADDNVNSPTYVGGPMGDVPNFIFDSLITTEAQALAEAEYNLAISISSSWTITVDSPPNPAFDIDDVVTVTDSRVGLNAQKMIIDTVVTSVRYDSISEITGRVVTAGM